MAERARRFRRLHEGPELLVLPNAWDVASARLVERAGFPAVGTASGAIASSLGIAPDEPMAPEEFLAVVSRICRAVAVPVSADLEQGHGLEPDDFVDALARAGAVGCNIDESSDRRPGDLVATEE